MSVVKYAKCVLQMDPGQDLLLAALSESGICPNDIGQFDVDAQDVAQPSTTQQVRWLNTRWSLWRGYFFNLLIFWCLFLFQSISISALGVGVGTESAEVVRSEPPTAAPVVNYSIKVSFRHLNCLLKVGIDAVGALLFPHESNFLSFSVISRINLSHRPPHLS